MTTILSEQLVNTVAGARADGEGLWLPPIEAERTTGWTLKPEGFCKGDVCVPVPPQRAREFLDDGDINVAALWRHMGLPIAHDAAGETWVLGTSATARSAQLQALDAPDFSLPDLDGTHHSLKAERGKKVLLVSWASW